MLTRLRPLIWATLLVLAMFHATGAVPPREQLQVSIDVTANPTAGAASPRCEAAVQVTTPRQEWWAAFGHVKPHPTRVWEAVDRGVGCGGGSLEKGASDFKASPGAPYLLVNVSTTAGLLPPLLMPERVLILEIALSLRKFSGFGTQGEPVYQESVEKRQVFFMEGGTTVVPLLVTNDMEMQEFGSHEVFLQVAAGRVEAKAPAYGVVAVTAGREDGALLLDGGVVGSIAARTEAVLRNVPVGLRLVGVRDAAGREHWQLVRVEAGRTVLVDLSLPDPPQDGVSYRLIPLDKNASGYEEYRRERDGAVVVKVPAGEFLMGNKDTERTPLEHQVYVSDFLMDKTPVTWKQFKKFAAATGIPLPPHDPYWGIHDAHPAVYVSWEEGKMYCEWAGGRLPTEAEREKAARGTDGRKYPWGNEEPEPKRGVYRHEWGYEATEAVGTHPAGVSPYGLLDMGGNVWEWCSDWYDDGYYAVSPPRDPKGPPSSSIGHVVRGGSWDSRPSVLSSSCRNWGHRGYREGDYGFRCAMNVPR